MDYSSLSSILTTVQSHPIEICRAKIFPNLFYNLMEHQFPPNEVSHLLNGIILTCQGIVQREGESWKEAMEAYLRPSVVTNEFCGYFFKKGDIAYYCQDCQSDSTCVLCVNCYKNSNHEGHDVFMRHRKTTGGMCDCGDSEAWAIEGFCCNHGAENSKKSSSISRNFFSPDAEQVIGCLIDQAVAFIHQTGRASQSSFSYAEVEQQQQYYQKDDCCFYLRLFNDDFHTPEELLHSFGRQGLQVTSKSLEAINREGYAVFAMDQTIPRALFLMKTLQDEGWFVNVISDDNLRSEEVTIELVKWLEFLCNHSPVLLKRTAQSFLTSCSSSSLLSFTQPSNYLAELFSYNPYIRNDITVPLQAIYLKIFGHKEFRHDFSLTYVKSYEQTMQTFLLGIGTQIESIFPVGVQIFTTTSIVQKLLEEFDLFGLLLTCFEKFLEMSRNPITHKIDPNHSAIKFKRYINLTLDFVYTQKITCIANQFINYERKTDNKGLYLTRMVHCLEQLQGVNGQKRRDSTLNHIEYSNGECIHAFSLYINLSLYYTSVIRGIYIGNTIGENKLKNSSIDISNVHFMGGVFWSSFLRYSYQIQLTHYDVGSEEVSFHYPVHHFFGKFILELASNNALTKKSNTKDQYNFLSNDVENASGIVRGRSSNCNWSHRERVLRTICEFPLRILVLSSQIFSDMWNRNDKQSMIVQVNTYQGPPFCRYFQDVDFALLQFVGVNLGLDVFLKLYIERFGLTEWCSSGQTNKKIETVALAEECLLCLIRLITELPTPPHSNSTTDNELIVENDTILRREVLHRLAVMPCSFTELLEMTAFISNRKVIDGKHSTNLVSRLTTILNEIAQPVLVNYDRCFEDEGSMTQEFYQSEKEKQAHHLEKNTHIISNGKEDDDTAQPRKYELKYSYLKEYDPSFYHLSRHQHEKAYARKNEADGASCTRTNGLKRKRGIVPDPKAMVAPPPVAHSYFSPFRDILFTNRMIDMIEHLLLRIVLAVKQKAGLPLPANHDDVSQIEWSERLLSRILHLLHLFVYQLDAVRETNSKVVDLPHVYDRLRGLRGSINNSHSTGIDANTRERKKRKCEGSAVNSDKAIRVASGSIVCSLMGFLRILLHTGPDFSLISSVTFSNIHWILKRIGDFDEKTNDYLNHVMKDDCCTAKHDGGYQIQYSRQTESVTEQYHKKIVETPLAKIMKTEEFSPNAAGRTIISSHSRKSKEFLKRQQKKAMAAMLLRQQEFLSSSSSSELLTSLKIHEEGAKQHHCKTHHFSSACIICGVSYERDLLVSIGFSQRTAKFDGTKESSNPFAFMTLCGHAVHFDCIEGYRRSLTHQKSNSVFCGLSKGEFLCPVCQTISNALVPSIDPQFHSEVRSHFPPPNSASSLANWFTQKFPHLLAELPQSQHYDLAMHQALKQFTNHLTEVVRVEANDKLSQLKLLWQSLACTFQNKDFCCTSNAVLTLQYSSPMFSFENIHDCLTLSKEVDICFRKKMGKCRHSSQVLSQHPYFRPLFATLTHRMLYTGYSDVVFNWNFLNDEILTPLAAKLMLNQSNFAHSSPTRNDCFFSTPLLNTELYQLLIALCGIMSISGTANMHYQETCSKLICVITVVHYCQILLQLIESVDEILSSSHQEENGFIISNYVERFRALVSLSKLVSPDQYALLQIKKEEQMHLFVKLFEANANIFLRKVYTLLQILPMNYESTHCRCEEGSNKLCMFDRLSSSIGMPLPEEIIQSESMQNLIRQWYQQLCDSKKDKQTKPLKLVNAAGIGNLSYLGRSIKAVSKLQIFPTRHRIQPTKLLACRALTFVELPKAFADLLVQVSETKCPVLGVMREDPVLCLLCGIVLCGGTDCCKVNGIGSCSRHSQVGCAINGVGVFLVLKKSSVLLIAGSKSCCYASPYVDAFGEQDLYLRRARPLRLSRPRLRQLLTLATSHQVVKHVCQRRRWDTTYIRDFFY